VPSDHESEVLSALLEHPFLGNGLTADGAYNYLLGRFHFDRRNSHWRRSARVLSYWMKKQGFRHIKRTNDNRYYWPSLEESSSITPGNHDLDKAESIA